MKKNLFIILLVVLILPALGKTQESLKINWPEEYKWKIGSNQEDASIHMIELIPEKETVEKWTIIGTMMSIKGVQNAPVEAVMQTIYKQSLKNAPKATLTMLEKDESGKNHWIIFKIEAPSFLNDKKPESQLFYVIQGDTSLYSNFVAIKEKTLSKKFADTWINVFKESELVNQ